MRRRRLAERADVVAPAFDGQQRGVADRAGIDLAAAIGEVAGREFGLLEDPVDRLDVEFLGEVEHGEILVVEGLDLLGLGGLARRQVLVELLVRVAVALHVHRHEGGELQEARIDRGPPPAIAATAPAR